ncbi:hypothetical protein GCM10009114_37100 [Aliiglaciecola litoralis]|uniref:Uncharacterized protein n=1 Tax=Aliiglaciecola litoralis TaxID=582857 RepID=A0ABP3X3R6_9ALTE
MFRHIEYGISKSRFSPFLEQAQSTAKRLLEIVELKAAWTASVHSIGGKVVEGVSAGIRRITN